MYRFSGDVEFIEAAAARAARGGADATFITAGRVRGCEPLRRIAHLVGQAAGQDRAGVLDAVQNALPHLAVLETALAASMAMLGFACAEAGLDLSEVLGRAAPPVPVPVPAEPPPGPPEETP